MSGFRVWRLLATTLLLLAAVMMAGCMGLTGSKNGGDTLSPSNPSPNPNPSPGPTPGPSPTPKPTPTPTPTPTPVNPTASITVAPTSIEQGGTVTVSWQTQNANSVSLTQNGTSVRLDGNPLNSPGMQFSLNTVGTTTFTLTATGASGTTAATASASVTVTAPPPPPGPTATLTANPTTVNAGNAVTLKWTTTNASSVKLTQNGKDVPIGSGQTSTVVTLNDVGTVSFVLTATGAQGATATAQASVQVTPATSPGDITAVNHIIFLAQENRSFDTYFGKLNEYRAKFGLSPEVDGLPDDCSSSNSNWTVKCSAMNMAPNSAGVPTTPIYAFHLKTMCIENTSADWIVSHWAFNSKDTSSDTPLMDGFVIGAASATPGSPGTNPTIPDKQGIRAMGFYTAQDLEYHYWLATQFGIADHWFSPAPARTDPNRYYMVGATSGGYAYPMTGSEPSIHAPTIFDRLQDAGVSWKIYSNELYSSAFSFSGFTGRFGPNGASPHIFKLSQYDTDLANGTLPAVAYIERADNDEHPGLGGNIQAGVKDTARFINQLMNSSSWKDSVFILTFDEAGGLYDHVAPPTNVPNPDGIKPVDICISASDPRCANAHLTHGTPPYDPDGDFTRYGFRVPTVVISPFSRPGYVSHRITDSTSWLKFVETRFKLKPLTARDASVSDMLDFFDFQNAPWKKPPSNPPGTPIGACYDGLP